MLYTSFSSSWLTWIYYLSNLSKLVSNMNILKTCFINIGSIRFDYFYIYCWIKQENYLDPYPILTKEKYARWKKVHCTTYLWNWLLKAGFIKHLLCILHLPMYILKSPNISMVSQTILTSIPQHSSKTLQNPI